MPWEKAKQRCILACEEKGAGRCGQEKTGEVGGLGEGQFTGVAVWESSSQQKMEELSRGRMVWERDPETWAVQRRRPPQCAFGLLGSPSGIRRVQQFDTGKPKHPFGEGGTLQAPQETEHFWEVCLGEVVGLEKGWSCEGEAVRSGRSFPNQSCKTQT